MKMKVVGTDAAVADRQLPRQCQTALLQLYCAAAVETAPHHQWVELLGVTEVAVSE